MSSSHAGSKRKLRPVADDETAAAGSASKKVRKGISESVALSETELDVERDSEEKATGRPLKGWKKADAGAAMSGDGKTFTHTWNEHLRDNSESEFKYGSWTVEEDQTLLEAYDEYCMEHEMHGFDRVKPVVDSVAGTDIHDCWLKVAAHFKHRTVRAVLRRAIRLLHPGNNRGAFDDEDLRVLLSLVQARGPQWKEIARVLNRLPNTVRNTYDRISKADSTFQGMWSASEETKLTGLVKSLGTLNSSGAYVDIPWSVVGERMASRTVSQCIFKWSSGFGLKTLGLVWDASADEQLVEGILADGGSSRDEVYWHKVFPGRHQADCKRRFDTLCKRLPHHDQLGFVKCVDLLAADMAAAEARSGSFAATHAAKHGLALSKPASDTVSSLPKDAKAGSSKHTSRHSHREVVEEVDDEEEKEEAAVAARKEAKSHSKSKKRQASKAAATVEVEVSDDDSEGESSHAVSTRPAMAGAGAASGRKHRAPAPEADVEKEVRADSSDDDAGFSKVKHKKRGASKRRREKETAASVTKAHRSKRAE